MYSNVTDADELPAIKKTDETPFEDTTRFNVWFDNGARLSYYKRNGKVYEDVFAPSDPDSAMEHALVASGEDVDVSEVRTQGVEMYDYYETVGELKEDWTNLAEWITHE